MFADIIFDIVSADTSVKNLLGNGTPSHPVRFYSFGDAPQNVALPYAVWQNISGEPINFLNQRPDTDDFVLQIDVYGSDRQSVRDVSKALNNVLETHAHVTRWGNEDRNPATMRFHFDFDVEFFNQRQ